MIILKFGGSSVKDAHMFKEVGTIISERITQDPIVVLSAVKGTTDLLIAALQEAQAKRYEAYTKIVENHAVILRGLGLPGSLVAAETNELKQALETAAKAQDTSKKTLDYISFFGERMSTKILAAHLASRGMPSAAYISGDIGMITDAEFGDATLLPDSYRLMKEKIGAIRGVVPIITGFGGKDSQGNYTTFQRGGSDYVASLVGAALGAQEIQIWTDVDGVLTCDPRIVPDAKPISQMSFDEASELAYFGAKVLHPKTILPAIEKSIPVKVLNTFNPEHPGTTIVKDIKPAQDITALTVKKRIIVIDIRSTRMLDASGYLAKIFEVFQKYDTPVDMLATSEVDVSLTIDSADHLSEILEELGRIAEVIVEKKKAIIAVVGEGLRGKPAIMGRIFSVIGNYHICMISHCLEGVSVGFVVDETDAELLLRKLHTELIA